MRNDQSTFIKDLDYLVDQFDELQDLRWSDLQHLEEYRELKMKKNDGLPIDQVRLDQLEPIFKNKIVTAARWNKFQNSLVGMQTFIKDEVEGFVFEKQQEINTVIANGKTGIDTSKDNALIAIENKKQNVMDYLEGTTAGQLRNDIGDMSASEVEGRSLIDKANNLNINISSVKNDLENLSIALPLDVKNYDSVSQWADILIPDAVRGRDLLEFLLAYVESSEQITSSEQAMLVIMQEERFDKGRQVSFDYDQTIFKLGQKTEVGLYLAWIEELLSDYTRGVERLELGLMLEAGSAEISNNHYVMNVIMKGESLQGLTDYRKKFEVV